MKRSCMLTMAALAVTAGFATSAPADVTLPLPPDVVTALVEATEPSDIAALVRAYPDLAATVMFEAALLGIASPAQVVALLAPTLAPEDLGGLVAAATEAAPSQADATVKAAFEATGAAPEIIAAAAIKGLETAGLATDAIQVEAIEIIDTLSTLAPDSAATIATAVADATSTPDDSAQTLAAAAGQPGIETADITEDAATTTTPVTSPIGAPSEVQNNPSGN